jgi:hypothetical protein
LKACRSISSGARRKRPGMPEMPLVMYGYVVPGTVLVCWDKES